MRCHALPAAVFGLLAGCADPGPSRDHVDSLFQLDPRAFPAAASTQAQRELGAQLFVTRLGEAACSDCHRLEGHGQDGRSHGRNTPALVDVSRQLVLGWDGEESNLEQMVTRELRDRCRVEDQQAADALVAFLDGWRTRGRWDRYVEGDDEALSAPERHGLATFIEVGCAACHAGRTLGGRSRHKLGAALPFATADTGLHAATGREEDRFFFKAPMLRMAAKTGPWLHDGSVGDLREVVRLMARHELGREVSDEQVEAIVRFLQAVADVDERTG